MTPAFSSLVTRLWCWHWPGTRLPAAATAQLRTSGVVLETCLRQLAFGVAPRPGPPDATPGVPEGELTTGEAAYRLLVEVASGLQSAVPGETNVFGQFRRAWDESAGRLAAADRWQLRPVVEAVLADTRTLRARHLQGVAGGSYGSLVRELLTLRRDARVLFVGTGELARSMLPLFRAWDVGLWNHSARTALAPATLPGVSRWFPSDEAEAAAAWATDIVLTTPGDPAHDRAWCDRVGRHPPRTLVHLGLRRGQGPAWPDLPALHDLDDVFALAGAREQQRRTQLAAAARACSALVARRLDPGRPVRIPASLKLASA